MEKVKCDYCEKILRKKNLKTAHKECPRYEGIKSQFLSISSVDIQDVFAAPPPPPPPPKYHKTIEEEEQELHEGHRVVVGFMMILQSQQNRR